MTFSKLQQKFPSELQGSMGVFTSKENAQEIFERTGHKRYYIKPDELIEIKDCTIATCTQWGLGNIMKFVDHVNAMENEMNIKNVSST